MAICYEILIVLVLIKVWLTTRFCLYVIVVTWIFIQELADLSELYQTPCKNILSIKTSSNLI